MSGRRGRYAPSPTGEIHLGNASTALLAWLSVRAAGGRFVMRLEDLDAPRVRAGAAERILADLAWLGLDWDEGYDRPGPHEPYVQSLRTGRYASAFERLRARGRLYPCFCSRKDIAAAASAPQGPGDELRYPGTCSGLPEAEAERRLAEGRPAAWRYRVPDDAPTAFEDGARGRWSGERPGDFVVWRSDATAAYQLAVVVDDAAMAIDEVVRGDDLLPSTLRQLVLYDALDLAAPRFAHVPLLLGDDGVRLSKRHAGTSLAELREAGARPEGVVGRIAALLGVRDSPAPVTPRELVGGFSFASVTPAPEGIPIDGTVRRHRRP